MLVKPQYYSFKDSAARVIEKDGVYYRYIFHEYKNEYDHLISSGLYNELINRKLLISHIEVNNDSGNSSVYTIIKPDQISF